MTQQYKSFDLGYKGRAVNLGFIDIKWDTNSLAEKEEEVPRTLWERLFSFPWQPFKKTKVIKIKEPAMYSYMDPIKFKMMFICHPAFKERIFREFSMFEVQ